MHECVFDCSRKCRDENFGFCVRAERRCEAADEDARIGADGRFGVELGFGEVPQELVIEYSVG